MPYSLYYIAVKSSLHSGDATVFGLTEEEVVALSRKYGSYTSAVNGVIFKAPPIEILNSLSEIGYKVACCSGESELTWTMMHECLNCNKLSVHQTLDELEFERGIWFAAQHNDISRVKHLIDQRKDVNKQDNFGYTALHYASRNGHVEMCKLLMANGADVNALTRSGKASPLHRCASMGHTEIFKLLLSSGALIHTKDGDGKTVLHRAVEGKHYDLAREIIRIDPSLKFEADNKGNIPILKTD